MNKKRIAFIGAGKVGNTLGKFLSEEGITVSGYYSRHRESAQAAARFTGSSCFDTYRELVENSDVIFLTVPDGEIQNVFQQLTSYELRGKQICHCSGALSAAEAFIGIEHYGAAGASIHPLFPISSKEQSYRELSDAFFCLEGAEEIVKPWGDFLRTRTAGVKQIGGDQKVAYHAACAIASNLYCGLMQLSLELLEPCGFSKEEGLQALAPLVRSNVSHILQDGPVTALTGPVERGDYLTVNKHREVISEGNDLQIYDSLTNKLKELAKQKHLKETQTI